jgi:phage host-nuclease inhibitor protein Gam
MDSVRKIELKERCSTNDVKPLDELYDIEDVAFIIQDLNHKIDIQKGYKKSKNQAIKDEVDVLQNKIDYFKKVIVSTLEKNGEKNLTLPDACKVSLRKGRPKWIVDDEEALLETLIETKEIENCAKKIEGWKTDKREVDKILNDWEKSENLPGSVHKELGDTGISISYIDKEEEAKKVEVDMTVPIKEEDYDELEW